MPAINIMVSLLLIQQGVYISMIILAGFGPKLAITDSIPKRVEEATLEDTTLRMYRGEDPV